MCMCMIPRCAEEKEGEVVRGGGGVLIPYSYSYSLAEAILSIFFLLLGGAARRGD